MRPSQPFISLIICLNDTCPCCAIILHMHAQTKKSITCTLHVLFMVTLRGILSPLAPPQPWAHSFSPINSLVGDHEMVQRAVDLHIALLLEMALESSSIHPHPHQTLLKKVTTVSHLSRSTAPSVMILFLDVNMRIKSLPKLSKRMLVSMSMRMLPMSMKEQENNDKGPGSWCKG